MSAIRHIRTTDGRIATVTQTPSGLRVSVPAKGSLPAEVSVVRV